MEKAYNRQFFNNNAAPDLDEDTFNNIDRAVDELDNRVMKMHTTVFTAMQNEMERQESEAERQENENQRQSNEEIRQQNEETRQQNEQKRERNDLLRNINEIEFEKKINKKLDESDERHLHVSGDNAMQGDLNMNSHNIKSGNKEIDLKDQSFELGIRESTGGSWDSHINIDEGVINVESTNIDLIGGGARLQISDRNFSLSNSDNAIYSSNESLHIDSYNNIDLLARNEGHINLTAADEISFFIPGLSNKHLFNISSSGKFELLAKNGMNIESGNGSIYIKMPNNQVFEIKSADMFRIYSNEYKLYCHPENYSQPHEFFRISKSGKTTFTPPKALDVYANNDIRIGTAGRIDLFPGTSSVGTEPSAKFAVRTGNLEGKILAGGSKPNITGFGNINCQSQSIYVENASDAYEIRMDAEKIEFYTHNLDDDYISRGLSIDMTSINTENNRLSLHIDHSNYYKPEEKYYDFTINAFYTPYLNPTNDIGTSVYKWRNIYAQNGTIQTSDRTQKNNITSLDDELTKCFIMGLIPSSYGMVNGTSGRRHWGLIAQDIENLMENLGMESKDFAGFIKSPRIVTHYEDENGNPLKEPVEEMADGEYDYSLRYDEFIAPLIRMVQMQQEKIQKLEEQIEAIQQ